MNNIGVAAHIRAASPGGPRYDASLNSEQRRSINNAIWLCAGCSIKIDRDVERYEAELLRRWKIEAEHLALAEQGKRLPEARDAVDQLVMAATGHGARFLPTAISNVHAATTEVLEALDNRFPVRTSFSDGVSYIGLHPKATVPFKIRVPPEVAGAWQHGLATVIEHGLAVKLPLTGCKVEGSPIFDKIVADTSAFGGTFSMVPHGRIAVLKLTVQDSRGHACIRLDDVMGDMVGGQKSARFAGTMFRGIVSIALAMDVGYASTPASTVSLEVDFSSWEGSDVRNLAFFDQVRTLSRALAEHWQVSFALEIEGKHLASGYLFSSEQQGSQFGAIDNLLGYAERARVVATRTGAILRFASDAQFSQAEHERLAEAVNLFEREQHFTRDDLSSFPPTPIEADAGAHNLHDLARMDSTRMLFVAEPQTLRVFGVDVPLPSAEVSLNGVRPRISEDLSCIAKGDSVLVTWEPLADFEGVIRLRVSESEGEPALDGSFE